MTVLGVGARRRAEQGDGLAGRDAASQLLDRGAALTHLGQVALAVLGPGQGRRAPLSVERGQKLGAGTQLLAPLVPRFLSFRQSARTVPADEQAVSVAGLLRVVPPARTQRHVWDDLRLLPFFCSTRAVE